MEMLKDISIRGRMAYLICSFERLLIHTGINIEEWEMVLDKLWAYTSVDYIDDWMYELAEYMPNCILEDTMDDVEYITEKEYDYLYGLYRKTAQDVLLFLKIIFECGTCEIYARVCDHSPDTLRKVDEAIQILNRNKVKLLEVKSFEKFKYSECDGYGEHFDGKELSILFNRIS